EGAPVPPADRAAVEQDEGRPARRALGVVDLERAGVEAALAQQRSRHVAPPGCPYDRRREGRAGPPPRPPLARARARARLSAARARSRPPHLPARRRGAPRALERDRPRAAPPLLGQRRGRSGAPGGLRQGARPLDLRLPGRDRAVSPALRLSRLDRADQAPV